MEGVDIHFNQQRVGSFNLALDNPAIRFPFPFILGQPDVEAALESVLRRRGFRVERGSEVVDVQPGEEFVQVILKNGEQLKARFVVGCDGAHSFVRKSQPNWKFEGRPINLLWAQCDGTLTDLRIRTTRAAAFLGSNGTHVYSYCF